MPATKEKNKVYCPPILTGRTFNVYEGTEINDDNVLDIVNQGSAIHAKNVSEMTYLYRYYKGDQPILYRQKDVRPEICNKIVENRANEIISFKVGYLCGEPIQYVGRNAEQDVSHAIGILNDMMTGIGKYALDRDLVQWQMICGTAFRLVLSNPENSDIPFEIYSPDPRDCFVVYGNDIGRKPLCGVLARQTKESGIEYSVFSNKHYWRIVGNKIIESRPHTYGRIPLIEYPAGQARLGAFEIVLPLLDAINTTASNRIDGVEQFIQALLLFHNVDVSEDDIRKISLLGGLRYTDNDPQMPGDVKYLVAEMNQSQTQTLVDHMYNTVLTICGIPNRNGGSSTSDTGAAVIMRDGWSLAEARAKDTELGFKACENTMLEIVLKIIRETSGLDESMYDLRLRDIDTHFTRRNYENIQSKAQVLISMLNNDKIHPLFAYQSSGIAADPEEAYRMGMQYYYKQLQKNLEAFVADKIEQSDTYESNEKNEEVSVEIKNESELQTRRQ